MSHHDSSSGLPPWGAADLVAASGDDPGGGSGGGLGGAAGLGAAGFMDLDEVLDDTFKVRALGLGCGPCVLVGGSVIVPVT